MTNPLVQSVQEVQVRRNPHEIAVHRRYNAFMLNLRGLSRSYANNFNPYYYNHNWITTEKFVPDIAKYFDLEVPKNDTIYITMDPFNIDKSGERFYHMGLNITYTTPGYYANIANLPIEICDKIFSFSSHVLQLKVQLTFTDTYPFEAPLWTLVEVNDAVPQTNLPYPEYKLSDYYENVIYRHNKINRTPGNWSPAIDIEKDILDFIRKINHFPEMFNAIQ